MAWSEIYYTHDKETETVKKTTAHTENIPPQSSRPFPKEGS